MSRHPELTPEQADDMRRLYRLGWTPPELARSFNVTRATVAAVLQRRGAYRPKPSKPGEK